jgi:translation initiation factor IF-2
VAEAHQIRINELARDLEIKAKLIVDYLPELGLKEKKTHSSSIDLETAEKVRAHFLQLAEAEAAAEREKLAKQKAAEEAQRAKPEAKKVPAAVAAVPPTAAKPGAAPGAGAVPRPGVLRPASPAAPAAPSALRPATAPATARPAAAPGAPKPPMVAPPGKPAAPAPIAGGVRPATPAAARSAGVRPAAAGPAMPARPAAAAAATHPVVPGTRVSPRPARPGMLKPGAPAPPRSLPVAPPKAEPGKPIYARKPAARARPLLEKRFEEGERKLHPVRTRVGEPARRTVRGGAAAAVVVPQPREPREVTLTEGITIRELAEKLDVRAKDLLKVLLDRGVFASINQALDMNTAISLAESFSGIVKVVPFEEQLVQEVAQAEKKENLVPRAPVVTVMGHVDHGKTTLLDAIRHTTVAAGEAGGITQHIGAYQVSVDGRRIVFIDTPGHEAFTRMRARGAKVTDIVVLVVAADDGVMPQTQEAIDHAKAAGVPIVVAVNKVDKPDAQPERVKRQLADLGLMPEEWGGDTVMVEVSAKTGLNLSHLLEMILLVADLRELKTNPKAPAAGTVLESRVDKGRGPVATVLVQNGTLHIGDAFLCGAVYGKVRAMFDDRGQTLKEAPPSTPVEVLGLQGIPEAGDQFQVAEEAKARHVVEYRQAKLREASLARTATGRITLDQLHEQLKVGEVKELPLVIKADVQGSVGVLEELLPKLSTGQVKLQIIHSSVGAVSETDVLLASASGAVILAFNVRPDRKAAELAQRENVEIRTHTVIYELIDEVKKALTGLLEPVEKETYLGRAEVRDTFRIKGVGVIAGCYVQDGFIKRDAEVRVLRDNVVIYTGRIGSLRRFKEDVSEVRSGFECGMGISNFSDIKVGDVLECFVVEKLAVAETTA